MPGILCQPIVRRRFLKAAAHVGVCSMMPSFVWAQDNEQEFRVALLSDTHIPANVDDTYRGFKPVENLHKVVPRVIETEPSAAIINGDAARLAGLESDYNQLKEILAPLAKTAPVFVGLGNHDDRRNFYKVFSTSQTRPEKQDVNGKHVTILESNLVRILVLDSLLYVNKTAGLLGKSQRTWLENYLPTVDNRPTVLFIHHTLEDGDGDLLDADRLFKLLQGFAKVKSIFYGHSHRYSVTQRHGIQLINLPAVGYNFHDGEPVGWIDAKFNKNGVQLKLDAIAGNQEGHGSTLDFRWLR